MNTKTWGVTAVILAMVLVLACSGGGTGEGKPKPKPSHDKTRVGAGIWEVGTDLEIGDWSTQAPPDKGCYWARLRNFERGFENTITHGIVPAGGQGKLAILEMHVGYEFSGPCIWEKNK